MHTSSIGDIFKPERLTKIIAHKFFRASQPALHIVVTGRDAPPELIEAADLVTEMKEIKHPFTAGIRAQQGIEF